MIINGRWHYEAFPTVVPLHLSHSKRDGMGNHRVYCNVHISNSDQRMTGLFSSPKEA